MAILNIDNTVPVENLSGACGQFSQAFSFDFPVCRALEGEVPVESIAQLGVDGVLNVEVLANLGVDKQTAVEIVVANSNFDFLFPVELLASIADDEIIPISTIQGEERIVPVVTFRSTLPVPSNHPMRRNVQEDPNIFFSSGKGFPKSHLAPCRKLLNHGPHTVRGCKNVRESP